jgi:hypothetical protein
MKTVWAILLVFFTGEISAQEMAVIESRLNAALEKISYWDEQMHKDGFTDLYDSLEAGNAYFEKLLLHYTGAYPGTISCNFKTLAKNHLIIATSKDGNFRIYTWNTLGGGTWRFYKTIFQYRNAKGVVLAKASAENREQEKDPPASSGCFYYQINDVTVGKKTYYLAQSKYILSNPYAYHNLKAFSIDKGRLNENAKLIKTRKKLQSEIGYGVDWSASVNKKKVQYSDEIKYNPKERSFTIPLVRGIYEMTGLRIKYIFNGKYFEKSGLIKSRPER